VRHAAAIAASINPEKRAALRGARAIDGQGLLAGPGSFQVAQSSLPLTQPVARTTLEMINAVPMNRASRYMLLPAHI
jgi:hypothetical protein